MKVCYWCEQTVTYAPPKTTAIGTDSGRCFYVNIYVPGNLSVNLKVFERNSGTACAEYISDKAQHAV